MDYIEIKNFMVFAYHGVLNEEKKLGQKFIFNLKLYGHLQKAGLSDNLEDSTDYSEICKKIEELVKENSVNLLETIAENIVTMLFSEYEKITKITLEVQKPSAPVPYVIDYTGVCITRQRHIAFIGMGSNIGNKKAFLDFAISEINASKSCKVLKTSKYITTKPYGHIQDQDDFLNAVTEIETILQPEELLYFLHSIEKEAKRERKIHWGPRTLDLDILLYDDLILNQDDLIIPHPEISKRAFVLEPLCEIAPYMLHPISRKYMIDLKEEL
jgi:dihydroneopterin aldolase/2-amino-4-hydroxy-6-hydroxymethyldihydropteridine diphosphokinase